MAKATSVRVPELVPAEPDLLSPAVKQLLRVLLVVGSTILLVGFVAATFVALF
jgi:hypothetical protein